MGVSKVLLGSKSGQKEIPETLEIKLAGWSETLTFALRIKNGLVHLGNRD